MHPHLYEQRRRPNAGFLVDFFLLNRSKEEIWALGGDAIHNKRRVRVMDGTNVLVEARVDGMHALHIGDNPPKYGLTLGFASLSQAQDAAWAVTENLEASIRRLRSQQRDIRSWQ